MLPGCVITKSQIRDSLIIIPHQTYSTGSRHLQHVYINALQRPYVHPTARFPRTSQSTPRRSTQYSSSSQPASCLQSVQFNPTNATSIQNPQQVTDPRQSRVQNRPEQHLPHSAWPILVAPRTAGRNLAAKTLLQTIFLGAARHCFSCFILPRRSVSKKPWHVAACC